MNIYEFEAEIQKHPGMDAAYIEFPYDVEKEFGTRGRVSVRAWFDGAEYRGSLANMGLERHCLGIPKKLRGQIEKDPGDIVQVRLHVDTEVRRATVPPELLNLFADNDGARLRFERLSYSHQREYAEWIGSAKRPETRLRRASRTIEMLGEAISGRRSPQEQ